MEKIITIDGRQVKLKATGALMLRYKAQFGRDIFKDLLTLERAVDVEGNKINDINALDLDMFYNLIWLLAKTADPQLPPPTEWLDSFSEFPLFDIVPEITDMIFGCISSTVPSKKK